VTENPQAWAGESDIEVGGCLTFVRGSRRNG
jgi:hypothetical protein